MTQKNTSSTASRKVGLFDPKQEAKHHAYYIGLCLHETMTPEAKKSVTEYLEAVIGSAYFHGKIDGAIEVIERNL